MANDITEIVFILDRSGSMGGKEADVVGGYNSFISNQLKEPGSTMVTTVLFNDTYKLLHNGVPAERALMDREEYVTFGTTALLDAVGRTITDVNCRMVNTPEYLRPCKVIFVITTDGLENASARFSRKNVLELIERQKAKYDWSFMFLGADIDAYAEAEDIGIPAGDVLSFDSREVSNTRAMNMACCMASAKRRNNKDLKFKDLI